MGLMNVEKLLVSLSAMEGETEWVEFKLNRLEHNEFGKYISALSNAALLNDEPYAYLVFGIEDGTHKLVGTTVRLATEKVGNEPLKSWVSRLLDPKCTFEFYSKHIDGKTFEVVRIHPSYSMPLRFKGDAYIRIDQTTQPLKNYPQREQSLWLKANNYAFESAIAVPHMGKEELLKEFDLWKLFERLDVGVSSEDGIISKLLQERLISDDMQQGYDATNALALLSSKDMRKFPTIAQKGVRVVKYKGPTKLRGEDDQFGRTGYAMRFGSLLKFIMDRIPHRERMEHGELRTVHDIPEIVIREILANSVIHQDFTQPGSGPSVEIFSNRVVFTNPGSPLVATDRFIDAPSKTRNPDIAEFMRRMKFCEKRGGGIDKAISAIETAGLPAPIFEDVSGSTRVTIFGPKPFSDMLKDDRIRACYQHACLRNESGSYMTNSSLRARFKLNDKQYQTVTKVIADAIAVELIKPLDPDQGNKFAKYVPFWA
jgi:predicted HTH transcriptional regulator